MPITYQQSGVDPDKAAQTLGEFGKYLKSRPRDPRMLSGIGPFAACFSLKDTLASLPDPLLVSCCDGVGTKALLALEWEDLGGLGQDLVGMNVNDLLCVGALPLVFLDYYACGALNPPQLLKLLHSIQQGCELAQCSLAGGETAEMPGLYQADHFDLAGFCVGLVDRDLALGPQKVQHGDRLVAIASSGIHANGFSLVRKLVSKAGLRADDATPFGSQTWKQALLAPTAIYVPLLKGWLEKLHSAAHLTGGGLFENLPRALPPGSRALVKAWEFPELFKWIQTQAELDTRSLLATFNCGVGFIAICDEKTAQDLVGSCREKGVAAWDAGQVEITAGSQPPEVVWE